MFGFKRKLSKKKGERGGFQKGREEEAQCGEQSDATPIALF